MAHIALRLHDRQYSREGTRKACAIRSNHLGRPQPQRSTNTQIEIRRDDVTLIMARLNTKQNIGRTSIKWPQRQPFRH